jgi:hypothetical protein
VAVQDTFVGQGDGEVQPGLPAKGGQQRLRLFAGDDLLDDRDGQGSR